MRKNWAQSRRRDHPGTSTVLFMLAIFLSACNNDSDHNGQPTNSDPDITTGQLFIEPYKPSCYGLFQKSCLRVATTPEGDTRLWYEHIIDFEYVWGHRYELNVQYIKIDMPMQDSSDRDTFLVEIVSDEEDSVGTQYTINRVDLSSQAIRLEESQHYYFDQPFTCPDKSNCDELLALTDSGAQVELVFQYQGNGDISLIDWR